MRRLVVVLVFALSPVAAAIAQQPTVPAQRTWSAEGRAESASRPLGNDYGADPPQGQRGSNPSSVCS